MRCPGNRRASRKFVFSADSVAESRLYSNGEFSCGHLDSKRQMVQKKLKAIDLFCGAGGLSLGLSRAGLELVGAVDFSTSALESYRRNFSHIALDADISKLSPAELCARFSFYDELDLLAGGPPCQGFSIQRIGEDEDHRNDLILELARSLKALGPRYL